VHTPIRDKDSWPLGGSEGGGKLKLPAKKGGGRGGGTISVRCLKADGQRMRTGRNGKKVPEIYCSKKKENLGGEKVPASFPRRGRGLWR